MADGELTEAEIGARVGVHRGTIARWKVLPVFAARVQRLIDEYGAKLDADMLRRFEDEQRDR